MAKAPLTSEQNVKNTPGASAPVYLRHSFTANRATAYFHPLIQPAVRRRTDPAGRGLYCQWIHIEQKIKQILAEP